MIGNLLSLDIFMWESTEVEYIYVLLDKEDLP